MTGTVDHPPAGLVGQPVPGGRYTLAGYESWLGHDALQDTMHFEFLGDPDRILTESK